MVAHLTKASRNSQALSLGALYGHAHWVFYHPNNMRGYNRLASPGPFGDQTRASEPLGRIPVASEAASRDAVEVINESCDPARVAFIHDGSSPARGL